jgi:hypothetical protein
VQSAERRAKGVVHRLHARTQYLSSSSLCPDHLTRDTLSSVVEAMWFLASLDRDAVLGETTESQCTRGKRWILVVGGLCCKGVERLPTGYPRLSILRAKIM